MTPHLLSSEAYTLYSFNLDLQWAELGPGMSWMQPYGSGLEALKERKWFTDGQWSDEAQKFFLWAKTAPLKAPLGDYAATFADKLIDTVLSSKYNLVALYLGFLKLTPDAKMVVTERGQEFLHCVFNEHHDQLDFQLHSHLFFYMLQYGCKDNWASILARQSSPRLAHLLRAFNLQT